MNNRYFNDTYENVCCLFCYFLEDTYLEPEERNDLNVIKAYVSNFNEKTMWATLNELKAVLALDPFPAEWIITITNLIRCHFEGETNEEKTYNWLQWVTKTLAIEAQKAGKI